MHQILMALMPNLLKLGSSSPSASIDNIGILFGKLRQEIISIKANFIAALVVSGIFVFALIRLLNQAELWLSQYEEGVFLTTIFYSCVVLLGVGYGLFFSLKSKEAPASSLKNPVKIVDSVLAGFTRGFAEGVEKERSRGRNEVEAKILRLRD